MSTGVRVGQLGSHEFAAISNDNDLILQSIPNEQNTTIIFSCLRSCFFWLYVTIGKKSLLQLSTLKMKKKHIGMYKKYVDRNIK